MTQGPPAETDAHSASEGPGGEFDGGPSGGDEFAAVKVRGESPL